MKPHVFSHLAFSVCAMVVTGALAGTEAAADPCSQLGTPSYTAQRSVSVAGHPLPASKVFVSGGMMREETELDGRRIARVTSPSGTGFVLDQQAGTAREIPMPPRLPPADKEANRIVRESSPDGTVALKMEFRRGGEWVEIGRTVCRKDGVLLLQDIPLPDDPSGMRRVVIRHSDIRLQPLASQLFQLPAGVTLSPVAVRPQ